MITLETLEHLPNAKKTVGKFIVGIEKQDGTNKRRLFYIGANVDRNQSKTQLLREAGFEKKIEKGLPFYRPTRQMILPKYWETRWRTETIIILLGCFRSC